MTSAEFLAPEKPKCPPALLADVKGMPKARLAIAAAAGVLPLLAAKEAIELDLAHPILFGNPEHIAREASEVGLDIQDASVFPSYDDQASATEAALACARGDADILMKGALHTDIFMKAAITRSNGLRTNDRFVHIFAIYPPKGSKPILISDAAVNVSPDLALLQSELTNMVALFHKLGNPRPKIALLSATEHPIASVPSSILMRELSDWAQAEDLKADVAGPLALDLIFSPEARDIKGLRDNPVAGNADGIIVPDLVSGNTLFKALVYFAGGCAAGVISGAKVPILLTSRADSAEARLASIALAARIR